MLRHPEATSTTGKTIKQRDLADRIVGTTRLSRIRKGTNQVGGIVKNRTRFVTFAEQDEEKGGIKPVQRQGWSSRLRSSWSERWSLPSGLRHR